MNKILIAILASTALFVNTAYAEIYGSFKEQIKIDKTTRTDASGTDTTITSDNNANGAELDSRTYIGSDIRLGFKGSSILNNQTNINYKVELKTTENETLVVERADIYLSGSFGKLQVGPLDTAVILTSGNLYSRWLGVNPFDDTVKHGSGSGSGGDGIGYTFPEGSLENTEIVINLGTGKNSGKAAFNAQTALAVIYKNEDYKFTLSSDKTAATDVEEDVVDPENNNNDLTYTATTANMLSIEYPYNNFVFGLAVLTGSKGANRNTATSDISASFLDIFYTENEGVAYHLGYGTRSETPEDGINTTTTNIGLEAICDLGTHTQSFVSYSSSNESNDTDEKTVKGSVITAGIYHKF